MTPYYSDELVTIYHGDCREIIPELRADVVIADPPYNAGKNYGAHDDQMEPELYLTWLSDIFYRAGQVSTYGIVYFPGTKHLFDAPWLMGIAGLQVRRVLGWHKKEFAGDLWSGGPAMSWEPIIWAAGDLPFFVKKFGAFGRDFLVVPSTHGKMTEHPCPKPLMVMKWLVGLFVPPGGTVLDPFAGTGTTLLAAKSLNCHAIGIEIEERWCEEAAQACAQGVLGLESA